MNFCLKNAPATFQRMVTEIFQDFLQSLMRVFIDDFSIFGNKAQYLDHLSLCLSRCRSTRLSLSPMKCAFCVRSGMLLGNIVFAHGVAVYPTKVAIIMMAPTPKTPKELS